MNPLSLILLQLSVNVCAETSLWHLHLALSSDPSKMYVQWTSTAELPSSVVVWGPSPSSLSDSFTGNGWKFIDSQSRTYFFNNASMSKLTPGETYYYKVGDGSSLWSDVYSFTATRSREQFTNENPLKIAWLGDLGYSNGQATPFLLAAAASKDYDHFVHVGDYAYNLPDQNGTIGDLFESSIENLTRSTPYMGGEGNHEGASGFEHYSNRFAVYAGDNSSGATVGIAGLYPTDFNNHWYSYNVGLVHFVSMSSEAYFFLQGL